MKKQIRTGVFETNSSSCHSVSFGEPRELNSSRNLVFTEDNEVVGSFEEFGWGYSSHTDEDTKLSYLLTMAAEIANRRTKEVESVEDFLDGEDFKIIEDAVKNHIPGCAGIFLSSDIKCDQPLWSDRKYLEFDGYIDHQSVDDYSCLQDFLDEYNVSAEDFIFDNRVTLIIDNDNH